MSLGTDSRVSRPWRTSRRLRRSTTGKQYKPKFEAKVALEATRASGPAGLRVVRILEAASKSLQGRGELVELKAQETIA